MQPLQLRAWGAAMTSLREAESSLLLEGLAAYKLFVGGLPANVTDDQIAAVAERFCDLGLIREIHVMNGGANYSRPGLRGQLLPQCHPYYRS